MTFPPQAISSAATFPKSATRRTRRSMDGKHRLIFEKSSAFIVQAYSVTRFPLDTKSAPNPSCTARRNWLAWRRNAFSFNAGSATGRQQRTGCCG